MTPPLRAHPSQICPGVTLWSADHCLVEALLQTLRGYSVEDLGKILVILPTQRVGTYVLASLARPLSVLTPPQIHTLESFIAQEALPLYDRAPVLAADAVEALLAHLIETSNFRTLAKHQAHEIAVLFSEMTYEALPVTAFETLKQRLAEEIYKSNDHVHSLALRFSELERLQQIFYVTLRQQNLQTGAEAERRDVLELVDAWKETRKKFSKIFLVGFSSAHQTMNPLVEILAKDQESFLWFYEPGQFELEEAPLGALVDRVTPITPCLQTVAAKSSPSPRQELILAARSRSEEVRAVLRKAMDLVDKLGVLPQSIAILVTNDREYLPWIKAAVRELGIEVNLALASPVLESQAGQWLDLYLELAGGNRDDLTLLLSFLRLQPTLAYLETLKPDAQKIIPGLQKNLCTRTPEKIDDPQEKEILQHLDRLFRRFPKSQPQEKFTEILTTLITDVNLFTGPEEETLQEIYEQFLITSKRLAPLVSGPRPRVAFFDLVRKGFLAKDLRAMGEPLQGIQILSLAEARLFPFAVGFILGCNEGFFPKALPRDELVDEYFKRQMGLSSWRALEAREDLTFKLLHSRLEILVLSYTEAHLGESLNRSRYVEDLLTLSPKLKVAAEILEEANACEFSWPALDPSNEGRWRDPKQLFAKPLSSGKLESLIQCPYRFLLRQLGIEPLELPDSDQPDPLEEGEWLHGVLEKFFQHLRAAPVDLRNDGLGLLNRLTTELAPKKFQNSALILHLQHFAWPQWLKHLTQIYETHPQCLSDSSDEWVIDKDNPTLRVEERELALSGKIDHLDRLPGYLLITDYKRKRVPDAGEVRQGLFPQLLVYAQGLQFQGNLLETMAIGYWSLLQGSWHPVAAGASARSSFLKANLATERIADLETALENLTANLAWRFEDIDAKGFYADSSQCRFCDLSQSCRREDSLWKPRLEAQKHLNDRLEKGASDAR